MVLHCHCLPRTCSTRYADTSIPSILPARINFHSVYLYTELRGLLWVDISMVFYKSNLSCSLSENLYSEVSYLKVSLANMLDVLVRLLLAGFLFRTVSAQSCWKNTTCSGPANSAFPGPWDSNIFSPPARIISPKSVLSAQTGEVIGPYGQPAKLSGNGSQLVFDFGLEVGGLVSLEYSATGPGSIGLAFTEAKNWIGEWSDSSNGGFKGPDGAIYANFSGTGNESYVMPDLRLRGGFRYLTLFLITNGTTTVNITDISLEIGFQPTWSNLRAYQGYFQSNDELLNRIWYSGAYTVQTNNVPVNTGRQVPFVVGWANNGTLGPGETIIVDGAKRDRAVWPGGKKLELST